MTLLDDIFDYIAARKSVRHKDLCADLGLGSHHASRCLKLLKERGKIADRRSKLGRIYYPITDEAVSKQVIARAQKFDGPFAILAAQVA